MTGTTSYILSKKYTDGKVGTVASGIQKVEYDETTSKIKVTYTNGDIIEYTIPTIAGRGIKNTVLNDDYTLTITFTDNTTYTTPSIRGVQGPIGPQGQPGIDGRDGAIQYSAGTGIEITDDNVINNTQTSAEWGSITGDIDDQEDLGEKFREVHTEISNLKNIGRFCAIWNASTGAPTSEPVVTPYTYKVGDYFRIGIAGYKVPTGLTYVPGAYDTVTEETGIGDVWYYDGTNWVKQASSGGGLVMDVQVNGTSILDGGIADIQKATNFKLGVVQGNDAAGININSAGVMNLVKAVDSELENKSSNYKVVVPTNLNKAVMEGLGNNTLTWPDAYKESARDTIGAQSEVGIIVIPEG